MKFEQLSANVMDWAEDKGILVEGNARNQMLKVLEEVGELSGALLKNDKAGIIDGIGDAFVTLIILSFQLGLTPTECLQSAWDEIKDRTGKTENGIFIKNT
jgi:NTP pyrophosphatase (non-canonical NTP hydrolase)